MAGELVETSRLYGRTIAVIDPAWAEPLDDFPQVAAYRQRLMERPSFARALREAEPYLQFVPKA